MPAAIHDAFARVPRHHFLPGLPLDAVYADDAVVTHDEGGVPTSSSSQPSLMARMLAQLDVRPGDRVLEIGAGTGYNAALLAALGAAVTTVELQPEVADAAREHLEAAGIAVAGDDAAAGVPPGAVRVVTGDGAAPARRPVRPRDRDRVAVGAARAARGRARRRRAARRAAARSTGSSSCSRCAAPATSCAAPAGCRAASCRCAAARTGRGAGRSAAAATRRRTSTSASRAAARSTGCSRRPAARSTTRSRLEDGMHALDALLWLGLQGDPLLSLAPPRPEGSARPAWSVALDVLPASLLVIELGPTFGKVARAHLHGSEAALRACAAAMDAWHAAGAPGPAALELAITPSRDRTGSSLPFHGPDGAATLVRGAHRWSLRYRAPE